MNIIIRDLVKLDEVLIIKLVSSLLENRKPKDGKVDYGLETHGIGIFGSTIDVPHPVIIYQSKKRVSQKSPIEITIKTHIPII